MGIRSSCTRRLFSVTSGAPACGAAGCAPPAVHSTMAARQAATRRIIPFIGRIIGKHAARLDG